MTTTHTNLALVEGDVYLVSNTIPKHFNVPVYNWNYNHINIFNNECIESERHGIRYSEIIASTAKLEGIPQLDRKHFVKPKVDVEALVIDTWLEGNQDIDRFDFSRAFKSGYNYKEAEFTREDMEKAFSAGRKWGSGGEINYTDFINSIRPLSLPTSIEVDDDFNVKNVMW